jgi:hypothetical protein
VTAISFEDLSTNVDILFDDFESMVAACAAKSVKKCVAVVLEDVDADDSALFAR